jgi:2-oxoglutarate dehydrogenase E1 component
MLRLKAAASSVQDFISGTFEPVLPDTKNLDAQGVTRVLLASGKVVHDLEAERTKRTDGTTAVLRVEQLAPLPAHEIAHALSLYPSAEIMWVQDEPANQGAWPFMAMNLPQALAELGETRALQVASRAPSASPATGSSKKHALQQAELIARAFDR